MAPKNDPENDSNTVNCKPIDKHKPLSRSRHKPILKSRYVDIPSIKEANPSSLYSCISVKKSEPGVEAPEVVASEAAASDVTEVPGDDDALFDEILSRTTHKLREIISQLPKEYRRLSEKEILSRHSFPDVVYLLRTAFWEQFNSIQGSGVISVERVFSGICAREKMYENLSDPFALAFFLCPPISYTAKLKLLLEKGIEKMDEVLSLPIRTKNSVDVRLISEILKIVSTIDNRLHGVASQNIKINQTNRNLNLNVSSEIPVSNEQGIDQELLAIDKEILLLSNTSKD